MMHALVTITNSAFGFGGVSVWIERITRVLSRRGWRVTTVTHALDESHLADWPARHPDIVLKPILGRFPRLNQIEPALASYLDREEPDVVVINCSFWMIPAVQRYKKRRQSVRLMGVAHADSNAYYDGLCHYRDCFDHVIGVSDTCYQKLLSLGYPPERVTLLPCGVPCATEPPHKSYEGPLRLAYVGRLVQAQKRVLDFVPLIQALDARQVDYVLTFCGSGEDEKALKQQVRAIDKLGRVSFHGWIPSDQVMTSVWRNSDVFLLLSAYEGISISMLEAMAWGVVPIASRVGSGVADVIREGETGHTFPIGDIDACADLVASLDRNRNYLATMSRQAWSVVHQGYSLEAHAQRLAGIFDMVLKRPAQTSPAGYMGLTANPPARCVPDWLIVHARRLFKRGDPLNEGYTTFP